MLRPIEMHEIQDKTRLLDELNETRAGVNEALASVKKLSREDKALNLIVKRLEERVVKAESRIENLMKAPKVKANAKTTGGESKNPSSQVPTGRDVPSSEG